MTKYLIIDTETTNSIDDPICYDVGFAIIDADGAVYEHHSCVVADVFLDAELMASAYFADKIPQYWADIKAGSRKLMRYSNIRKLIADTCAKWDVHIALAHNMRFDYRSTNTTQRFLTCSKYRYFLPYGIELWDTLKMARAVFKNDDDYGAFCFENGFMTKRNQRQYTAEVLYRYLTNDPTFEESHTGLEDVMIEKEIFVECLRRGCEDGKLWE